MIDARDLSLAELGRMLRETEASAGCDSQAARLLRRIIERRETVRDELVKMDQRRGAGR